MRPSSSPKMFGFDLSKLDMTKYSFFFIQDGRSHRSNQDDSRLCKQLTYSGIGGPHRFTGHNLGN